MGTRRANDAAIVMFGDGRDWHGKSLSRAFKRRGIVPLIAPLNACGFSTETATGLSIPGLGDRLPEGAFVRFVPGGPFEEVTLYLGVLHALRERGVTVWNVSASRPASGNGRGLSSITFTSVKTAVVAPMPNASEMTATAVNAGDFRNDLSAYRPSCAAASIQPTVMTSPVSSVRRVGLPNRLRAAHCASSAFIPASS